MDSESVCRSRKPNLFELSARTLEVLIVPIAKPGFISKLTTLSF